MGLAAFSIRNAKFVWFTVVMLTLGGISAFFSLGQLEDPEFTIKTAVVTTLYPGASPDEVEQEVTERIELKLQEIKEIDYISSESRAGVSTIKVEIRPNYWSDQLPQIWDTLRRKVRDVETDLPPGAGRPAINDDFGDVFGLLLAMTSDGFSARELDDFAEDFKRELSLIDGVGRVDLWGDRDRVIYLETREEALAALGVSAQTILNTLQTQNAIVDAGRVNIGDYRMRIAPSGAFTSPKDIADLVVRPSGLDQAQSGQRRGPELLRLGEIVEVQEGYADPPTTMMRYNGLPSIGLAISFQSGVNVVSVGEAVDARVTELIAGLPVGIEVERVHWQSDDVNLAVSSFLVSLGQAVAIVLVVLTLAMGVRMGIIIGSGLILTILATFIPLAMLGIDLQRMSLGALIIALGMMVDNSIVVADGAMVRMSQGMDRAKAAIDAATRPAMSLLGATFVAVMAFYPIFASVESAGEYCRTLFSVVGIALLVSWLLSMTVTPLQCVAMLPDPKGGAKETFDTGLYAVYRRFLAAAIRVRYLTIGVAVAALVIAGIGFGTVTQLFFPTSSMTKYMIDYYAPEGTRIEAVSEAVTRIEAQVEMDDRVTGIASFIGAGPPRFYLPVDPEGTNPSYAQVIVNVEDYRDIPEMTKEISLWIAAIMPEATSFTRQFGVGPSNTWAFENRIIGPADADPETLREIGDRAVAILDQHPWTKVARTDWRNRVLKTVPDYDQDRARWTGITYEDLGNTTKRAFDGRSVGLYREGDELLPIIVRPGADDVAAVDNFELLQLQSPFSVEPVPLAQVVRGVNIQPEDPTINRRDRRRVLTVQANPIDSVTLPSYRAAVLADFDALEADLPPGYSMEWGGEYEDTVSAQASLIPGMIPAFSIMALIVVGLFNSYRRPLVIFLTVPFVLIGIVPSLLLTNTPFGFVALLGGMSLAGMMIKNAIVLIDQINDNLAEGQPGYDAVLNAGASRLRPVVLAAATTVLGVIPLLPDVFWVGLAVTIMGGLTVGTMLTMILVPVLFATLSGIRHSPKAV
ncbi:MULTISPECIES: efflux RND transporter permease subunit [unclassified Ruegeria]|uniref:efflux RND transporter permease subunit n=1 Tax=unclassified Ruegeria TaxID=2625375 RepID=UPI0014895750|nr:MULTISPECIES: efflux RND transporter permease subunit [unclassified Ruegeria]NOE36369.1 AcrB/AcrD/AcrF family protein [Ruegeria sp. HKCCD7318]